MTYTKTYTWITFANPYLRCDDCNAPVSAMRSDTNANIPCGHLGVTSECRSWSPVDGCVCGRPHHVEALTAEVGRLRSTLEDVLDWMDHIEGEDGIRRSILHERVAAALTAETTGKGQKVYDPERPGYVPYCTCAGPFPEVGIGHEPHCLLITHPAGPWRRGSRMWSVLRNHYLAGVECDHEARRDRPSCSCSLVDLGWHPSVGAAVEAWIDHVMAVAAAFDEERA